MNKIFVISLFLVVALLFILIWVELSNKAYMILFWILMARALLQLIYLYCIKEGRGMKFKAQEIVLMKQRFTLYNVRVSLTGCAIILFGASVLYLIKESKGGWVYVAGGLNLLLLFKMVIHNHSKVMKL